MKVNENAVLIPQNSGVGKPNSSSNSTALNPNANKVAADSVAGPAVNLDISLTAKLAEVQSDNAANKVTDEALIEKLRNQVAAGDFKIDYKMISQAMLKDVVAAIGKKSQQA
jgi:anti-sigma28 factor (negative regulator of flagellin synthesis)